MSKYDKLRVLIPKADEGGITYAQDTAEEALIAYKIAQVEVLNNPETSIVEIYNLLETYASKSAAFFKHDVQVLLSYGLDRSNIVWLESAGVILWNRPDFFKTLLDSGFAVKKPGEQHLIFALLDNNSKECTKYLLEKIGGFDSLKDERDKFNRTFDEVLKRKGLTRETLFSWTNSTEEASVEVPLSASAYHEAGSATSDPSSAAGSAAILRTLGQDFGYEKEDEWHRGEGNVASLDRHPVGGYHLRYTGEGPFMHGHSDEDGF